MSGFAVIVDFSGAPVDPAHLGAMASAIAYRGPDGIGSHVAGPLGMTQLLLATGAGPERAEPLASADGSLLLVMDGYLTHPEELRQRLEAKGLRPRDRGDAELVLQAYATWGADCAREILGEYAFVVWDGNRREVFAARDHAALRPLHYAWNGRRLTIASDLAGVLADPSVPRRPNPGMIAEFLANDWFSLTETLWQDVMRLRGAHHMRVSAAGPHVSQYWMPPLEPALRYRREEDYFAHYREVLTDSVRRTARTSRPLGCEVSGGLDSSAIFAVADKLMREGKLPAPDLKGYTYRFPEGHPADEGVYARAVGDHLGRQIQGVEPFHPDLDWFARRGHEDCDYVPFPNAAQSVAIGAAATADGCRVVLNGEGGDEFLWGYPLHYHEDLSRGDIVAAGRSLAADWRDHGGLAALKSFARYGLAPFAPAPARAWRRRILANRRASEDAPEYWMTPRLRQLIRERREAPEGDEFAAIANRARRAMYMNINQGFVSLARDFVSRQAARCGYDYRTPMHSRDFVKFCFAIPENLRLCGATFKYIHVRAMEGLLPDLVVSRRTKADFISVGRRAVRQIGPMIAAGAFADFPDYFENEGIIRLWERHEAGAADTNVPWQLWGCFSCRNLLGTST